MSSPAPHVPEPESAPPPRRGVAAAAARVVAKELRLLRDALRSWADLAAALWARRPPARRAVAIAFVAAAGAAGLAAVAAQARLPARLPSARDWAALRALLERDARPGDAVALSPAWAERARGLVPPAVAVLAQRDYDGEDLVGVRRIWVVSLRDAPGFAWETEAGLLARAARSDRPERLGALEVTRYDVAFPTLPLAFLPDRLGEAQVSLGTAPCLRDGAAGFRCDGDGAPRVAREIREVAGAARPCLVARVGGDAPLVVELPAVRIGRLVRGRAGPIAGGALGAPLRLAVVVAGEEVGAVELAGDRFAPFQLDTTRLAGEARSLALVLSTPAAHAELCVEASTLP